MQTLMRVPGVRSSAARDRYVRELSRLLDADVAVPRSEQFQEDIEGLVRWCAGQPDGLRALAALVRGSEGPSAEADLIETLAEIGRPARVLEPTERRLVERLLTMLDDRERRLLLRGLTARWSERNRPDASDPQALLSGLEDSIPGVGDLHPLYVVLNRLTNWGRLLPDDLDFDADFDAVSELAFQVGRRIGIPVERLADPLPPVEDSDRQYLVVRLDESGRDPSRMLMAIWLVGEDGVWLQRYMSVEETHTLEQVGPRIDEELDRLGADEIDVGDLRIEFILPRRLLTHPVDQWPMAAPGVLSPIGVHYPVAIRDLVRMRNKIIRKKWRLRCQSLAAHATQSVAGAVRFEHLNVGDRDPYAELIGNRGLPVCIVVRGRAAEHVPRRIQSWLTAGIPVIAWCRHDDAASQFDQRLEDLIDGRGVHGLPEGVWELRQEAGQSDPLPGFEPVGRNVALLWDDAERIPPDDRMPLRLP